MITENRATKKFYGRLGLSYNIEKLTKHPLHQSNQYNKENKNGGI